MLESRKKIMINSSKIINSPYFDLSLTIDSKSAEMVMSLKTSFQTTKSLPHTYETLNTYLPGVLCTKCFNADNLPFEEKVKDTNIAHLFEHILLEYLIDERKKDNCDEKVTYRGVTTWDWREGKDPVGTYRITVSVSQEETMVLHNALRKAIELVERLLKGMQPAPAPLPAYAR